jgi:hypothetical protein
MPAGRKAHEHLFDAGRRDPFGLLDRLADRRLARGHVGDIAALDAAARALAGAQDVERAVGAGLRDQRADLGRSDVESPDQIAGRWGGAAGHVRWSSISLWAAGPAAPHPARRWEPGLTAVAQLDDHLAVDAHVEAQEIASEQLAARVHLHEALQRSACLLLPFRQ